MSKRPILVVLIFPCVFALVLSVNELRSTFAAIATNNPPVAVNDSYTIHYQQLLSLRDNDYDPDNGDYFSSSSIATPPQHGTLSPYNVGVYSYRAASGYVGSDSFTYTISDNHGAQATASVNLTIVNQPPITVPKSFTVHTSLLISPAAGDYDPDHDGISFNSIVTQPQHGTLSWYNSNTYVYQPTYGYVGSDSFTYSIIDSPGATANGTVNITDVNQGPIAVPDFYVKESGALLMTPT